MSNYRVLVNKAKTEATIHFEPRLIVYSDRVETMPAKSFTLTHDEGKVLDLVDWILGLDGVQCEKTVEIDLNKVA